MVIKEISSLEKDSRILVNETKTKNIASYYYWILSNQYVDLAKEDPENKDEMLAKFYSYQTKANIYHAYHTIQVELSLREKNEQNTKIKSAGQ